MISFNDWLASQNTWVNSGGSLNDDEAYLGLMEGDSLRLSIFSKNELKVSYKEKLEEIIKNVDN